MTAETAMKPIHILTILLILTAAPLFAARRNANIVDDVIRMQKSGIAEDEIIAFVHKGDTRLDVTADDMIALHDAGVSRNVIKAILDESDARGERRDGNRGRDYGYSYAAPSFSYGYYGVPYFYDPWYYNPWYYGYGPRVSVGFNFGFGRYWGGYRGGFRGGFRHRHR
jgi:hypothetical protein